MENNLIAFAFWGIIGVLSLRIIGVLSIVFSGVLSIVGTPNNRSAFARQAGAPEEEGDHPALVQQGPTCTNRVCFL